MNTLVSPSQIFCEKCQQMVKCILNAIEKHQNQLEEDELYEKTIDFLHSNLYLLRDMKMISGFANLLWILVDFRIHDNSYEKRKQIAKDLEEIIETILELAENEDIVLCTTLRRMQIYFSISAVYSKLKPVANVVIIDQCYLEAESIVKFANESSEQERKKILDLWETIKTSHELRNIHSVMKNDHTNHGSVNYIRSDPFEGGSLYAPSLKRKETLEICYKPRRRQRRVQKKMIQNLEGQSDDDIKTNEISGEIKPENIEIIEAKNLVNLESYENLNKIETPITDVDKNLETLSNEEEIQMVKENEELNEVEVVLTEDQVKENREEVIKLNNNDSNESDSEKSEEEPPEIPTSEPPELTYEPVFSPYSYITNSSLRNPPLFHPIMLPRDPTKGILPPLKIDPPVPPKQTNDIPVIVRNVIAELNEKTGANIRPFERTVKPIINLERNKFSLQEFDFD